MRKQAADNSLPPIMQTKQESAMNEKTLTQKRLKDVLYYSIISGKFYWQQRVSRRIHVGDVAGNLNGGGYIQISIDNRTYYAHRLSFLYIKGALPPEVDHDNHVRHANQWINIKASCRNMNGKNLSLKISNTSGITGVAFLRRDKLWRAKIMISRINFPLYLGKDLFEACCRRKSAEIKYAFHHNHGLILGGAG